MNRFPCFQVASCCLGVAGDICDLVGKWWYLMWQLTVTSRHHLAAPRALHKLYCFIWSSFLPGGIISDWGQTAWQISVIRQRQADKQSTLRSSLSSYVSLFPFIYILFPCSLITFFYLFCLSIYFFSSLFLTFRCIILHFLSFTLTFLQLLLVTFLSSFYFLVTVLRSPSLYLLLLLSYLMILIPSCLDSVGL